MKIMNQITNNGGFSEKAFEYAEKLKLTAQNLYNS